MNNPRPSRTWAKWRIRFLSWLFGYPEPRTRLILAITQLARDNRAIKAKHRELLTSEEETHQTLRERNIRIEDLEGQLAIQDGQLALFAQMETLHAAQIDANIAQAESAALPSRVEHDREF
jgi:hypothetical protein